MAPGLDEGARVGREANGGTPCGGDRWRVAGYDQREEKHRAATVDEGGGEMLVVLGAKHEDEEGEVAVAGLTSSVKSRGVMLVGRCRGREIKCCHLYSSSCASDLLTQIGGN